MEIESVDISRYHFSKFDRKLDSDTIQKQNLPFLSVVQSKKGVYGLTLGDNDELLVPEGRIYVAPSFTSQSLRHYRRDGGFGARYLFIDVIVNKKYRLDDLFDFPPIPTEEDSRRLSSALDRYEEATTVPAKMMSLYGIVDILIDTSKEKDIHRSLEIYPLVEYVHANYMNPVGIKDMASVMNMSESNLFSFFKRATGDSPIRFLNDYRLSVACGMLCHTDLPVGEIASAVGVPDQFYFSRIFKSKYGVPPVKYRKNKLW